MAITLLLLDTMLVKNTMKIIIYLDTSQYVIEYHVLNCREVKGTQTAGKTIL